MSAFGMFCFCFLCLLGKENGKLRKTVSDADIVSDSSSLLLHQLLPQVLGAERSLARLGAGASHILFCIHSYHLPAPDPFFILQPRGPFIN